MLNLRGFRNSLIVLCLWIRTCNLSLLLLNSSVSPIIGSFWMTLLIFKLIDYSWNEALLAFEFGFSFGLLFGVLVFPYFSLIFENFLNRFQIKWRAIKVFVHLPNRFSIEKHPMRPLWALFVSSFKYDCKMLF